VILWSLFVAALVAAGTALVSTLERIVLGRRSPGTAAGLIRLAAQVTTTGGLWLLLTHLADPVGLQSSWLSCAVLGLSGFSGTPEAFAPEQEEPPLLPSGAGRTTDEPSRVAQSSGTRM